MAPFFLNTEPFITGIVMANYTNGAPVRGNLTLKASVRPIKPIDINRMLKKNRPRPIETNLYNPYGPNDYWKPEGDYGRRYNEDQYNRCVWWLDFIWVHLNYCLLFQATKL